MVKRFVFRFFCWFVHGVPTFKTFCGQIDTRHAKIEGQTSIQFWTTYNFFQHFVLKIFLFIVIVVTANFSIFISIFLMSILLTSVPFGFKWKGWYVLSKCGFCETFLTVKECFIPQNYFASCPLEKIDFFWFMAVLGKKLVTCEDVYYW